ncbi:MAG: enoyl-CoA hydratase/isomerase family protein, partial [Phenylobacterium sp.]|nr:enoyl-CoA hydratase/isomerase family protein [Phenylobacterium sp.]
MSTKADHLSITVQDHVATLVFHRPPANHASVDLVRDLADALLAFDRDPAVRASVLASDGKPFCAGADLASPTGIGGAGMGGVSELYD